MENFKYRLIYIIMKTIALLPLGVLYIFSDFMYVLMYHVVKYRRKVVKINLKNSFPDYSDKELLKIEKNFYRHLADCFVETIKLLHISDSEADKRIVVKNGELIDELSSDGRSVILLLGHYGNWEWITAINRHFRISNSFQIYRPLKNHAFDRLMLKIRGRFGSQCIPQKKAIRTLVEVNRNSQFVVGFVADQRPNKANVDHCVNFLNQQTICSVGGEYLSRKLNTHILFVDLSKPKRGHYEIEFKKIEPADSSSDYPVTDEFMHMLERNIIKNPHLWLWSHNRWSRKYK